MRQRSRSQSPAIGAGADVLFAGRDLSVSAIYQHLLSAVDEFGPVVTEAQRTSIHLVAGAGGSAFAGVHPRKAALLLTIRSAVPFRSPRVRKIDQVSKHRFHNDVLLAALAEVDGELLAWLRAAYDLASATA